MRTPKIANGSRYVRRRRRDRAATASKPMRGRQDASAIDRSCAGASGVTMRRVNVEALPLRGWQHDIGKHNGGP